ncbi:uncharacterized protein C19orf47 homolog [Trichonephila inaurata madagascariensis]|uniref:Uncharacterized protein C19orf47 homolog n=1 Tax=Trichonephila inaurata madagascariensis TaxID=2747483 RepID=A0A8X6WZI1_9ARAC|nr:uncharacterized protein C19orf47 homolog [Trichonephila inaurata madagascariensis]
MAKTMDTSQWIQFFRKAGLPPNVAANYALIFYDNRIQVDMLLDLSKEYLYDMDIKVMGDVIAILKYAKQFHNQLAKERVIGSAATAVSKTAVAERMVGHYTRSVIPSPIRSSITQGDRGLKKKSTIISLKRKASEESPVKRIRRVPPEEEGAYKIKMPSGTTDRTLTKRSVFARLGDSAVSSSTDSKGSSSVFERLGPSSKNICDDTPSSTVLSDFERPSKREQPLQYRGVLKMTVGKNRTVTTTASRKANAAPRTVIKPRGFQRPNITKTVKLNQINSILQASISPGSRVKTTSQGIFGNRIEKTSVKSRLGDKIDARNLTRTTMQLKNRVPTKSQSNVFARLGR